MNLSEIPMDKSWYRLLEAEFQQPYFQQLSLFLQNEASAGKTIYPPMPQVFSALNATPFDQVKVVILGQDPYHGPGQAHGLCFSVQDGVQVPPSLRNIYAEVQTDLGKIPASTGNLTPWARSGVLLLNSVLTVEAGLAASHQKRGWERFTDRIVTLLNDHHEHLVFLLWGNYALQKGAVVNRQKHLVLTAPHPSPLSAHRGFLGSRPFSKANAYLMAWGKSPVDWAMSGANAAGPRRDVASTGATAHV